MAITRIMTITRMETTTRTNVLVAWALWAMAWGGVATTAMAQEPFVEITFLDVGQGDAIVVRAPEGGTAMIDAGRSSPLRYLQHMRVQEIDLLVATHPHADHIGGIDDVLTARPVRFYMDNGRPHTTDTYRQLMATLERLRDVTYLEAVPRTITLGSVTLDVLPLPTGEHELNDRSVGLVMTFGDFSAFFGGDSEQLELSYWVEAGVVPDVTLLKASHHGARNGFTPDFLEAAHPEVVVVSVGAENPYHHPRPEALAAYRSFAEHVQRTDRDGHVTVIGYADGRYEIVRGPELTTREVVASGGVAAEPSAEGSSPLAVTVFADADGNGPESLNGEYVVIENRSSTAISIGRWSLCDISTRCYRFPDGSSIQPDRRVVVYTGYGISDGISFFMNNDRAVWNDDGDEARLFDENGHQVLRHVYE